MIGIGLDAVDVDRFRALVGRRPAILERIFSSDERADLAARVDPVPGLAARFAAKEATMKALGVGLGGCGLAEVEIIRRESGEPELRLSGRAAELAGEKGAAAWHVSLTHTDKLAGAVVLFR